MWTFQSNIIIIIEIGLLNHSIQDDYNKLQVSRLVLTIVVISIFSV